MKQNGMRLGLTVLAALALAGGGVSAAQAHDGYGKDHHGGPTFVVNGDNNHFAVGDENVIGRDGVVSSGHSDTSGVGAGEEVGTPAQPYGTVISPSGVVKRAQPTTNSANLGTLAYHAQVGLNCKVHGQNVDGNDLWYLLRDGSGWVAARYVQNTGTVPFCPSVEDSEGGGTQALRGASRDGGTSTADMETADMGTAAPSRTDTAGPQG
ncbi:SH3 domain-containing protein [Streptomyces sp. WAC 00631]|uniref:SH3 domain-containing protein n=1 Tax=unclassified Streptomyces TaxID=2593676 RepID=UPI00163CA91B|nr:MULTISPECIES: SH3 domain-containing protein [unclassified Streptomyces]MCC5033971.1 SH3 domain-containing protein [Streptomyces sp. WAC 00631]MCC9742642.1 SH3 domain-containing protein [Streptomyces sp. MNU89]